MIYQLFNLNKSHLFFFYKTRESVFDCFAFKLNKNKPNDMDMVSHA